MRALRFPWESFTAAAGVRSKKGAVLDIVCHTASLVALSLE